MKAILKVGYHSYLFPDAKTAAQAMTLLSGAVAVDDYLYKGELHLSEAKELGIEMVNKPFKLLNKGGEPAPAAAPERTKKGPRKSSPISPPASTR